MKKLIVTVLGLTCAMALTAQAGKGEKKHQLTDEQKAVQKEITAKYDANKDGKLDKEERAKISKEDKEKMEKAGLGHKRGEKKEEAK